MEPSKVFAEWTVYASESRFRARKTLLPLTLAERKLIALSGVRRAGKSSLLMHSFQKAESKKAYVNLEDSRLAPDALDKLLEWFGDEGTLFLDEISSIEGWEGWLARVHEMAKGRLKIICSSSRASFIKPAKPLRGRMANVELFPLSFAEFLEFKGITPVHTVAGRGALERMLEEYLIHGGFPEVVLTQNNIEKLTITQEYFSDIVALDVAEASSQNVELAELFGAALLKYPYFSASKFVNTLKSAGYGVAKSSLLSLERCMEEAYLFFFVPIFSFNIADRLQYSRKVYPVDTGFLHAVTGIEDKGRFYETAVFLKLRREKSIDPLIEINYWKSKEGHEVDFVIRKGMEAKQLIQVVYELGEENKSREIRAILKAAKEFGLGKEKDQLIVVTKNHEGTEVVDGCSIHFVMLRDWLLR